ncbi:MAG: hypothetical protein DRJ61_01505 [Acidobacteria bacterium]|nr:MAG: hypothetical protein DRJ61_01505 [Acidobacteriota bacterium]
MTDETPQGANPPPPPEAPATPPPPPEPPAQPAPEPSTAPAGDNRTIMIVLSYLGILALIPFLVEKNDAEVQWHAKHGLVLTAAEFVLFIGLQIVTMILGAISGGLGCLIGILIPVLALGILVLHVVCILKGLKGERFIVPKVSEFADKF